VYDYHFDVKPDQAATAALKLDDMAAELNFLDMTASGIGIAFVRYEPGVDMLTKLDGTAEKSWQYIGLNTLIAAYDSVYCGRPHRPPALGLYLETRQLGLGANGTDLRTEAGKDILYRAIESFYCRVPNYAWARMDDKPLVILDPLGSAQGIPFDIYDYLRERFKNDFDAELYIVRNRDDLRISVDPEAAHLSDELRFGTMSFEEAEQNILSSDSLYHQAGDRPDSYLKYLNKKLFFEDVAFPVFSVKVGDVTLTEERRKFVGRLFRSKQGREIWAFWLSLWKKLYKEDSHSWLEIRKDFLHGWEDESYWLNVLSRGVNEHVVRKEWLASDDFYKASGHSPLVFIHNLFETVMSTCATESEIKTWQRYLEQHGVNLASGDNFGSELRAEVAAQFLRLSYQSDIAHMFAYFTDRYPGFADFADSAFASNGQTCPQFRNFSSFGILNGKDLEAEMSLYESTWKKIVSMDPPPPLVVLLVWNNLVAADVRASKYKLDENFVETTKTYSELYRRTGDFLGVDRCP